MAVKSSETIDFLTSLGAVREQSWKVYQLGLKGELNHFDVDEDRIQLAVDMIIDMIARDYSSVSHVPAHSRWRHFGVGGVDRIFNSFLKSWDEHSVPKIEQCRRLLDLFVVSVLLDAGAGDNWVYVEPDSKQKLHRSEGLAVASLHLFERGRLSTRVDSHGSGDLNKRHRVDADALVNLDPSVLTRIFQVTLGNPLVGVEGRTFLLNRLGKALLNHPDFFYNKDDDSYRPGNMVDYLIGHKSTAKKPDGAGYIVDVVEMWSVIMKGFAVVWPASRTTIDGVPLGDVWSCSALSKSIGSSTATTVVGGASGSYNGDLVPFHKLSQWLAYSLFEPMVELAGVEFTNMELMTGLAEYRNGGLFVDLGVLRLRKDALERGVDSAVADAPQSPREILVPTFEVQDQVIVEWRALTVSLLDIVGEKVRQHYGKSVAEMPLTKVLEAGTWKAGRELAARMRPDSKGPPIQIISDGTVF